MIENRERPQKLELPQKIFKLESARFSMFIQLFEIFEIFKMIF